MTSRISTSVGLAALISLSGCSEAIRPQCGDSATCSQLATLMMVVDTNLRGYDHSQVTTTDGQTVDFWFIEFGGVSDCPSGCVHSHVCVVVSDLTQGTDALGFRLVTPADARTSFTASCEPAAQAGTSDNCHFAAYDMPIWDDPQIADWIADTDNGCRSYAIEAMIYNSLRP